MNHPKDPETILYGFSVEPSHDQETLQRYLSKHPELTEELIDLAFELRLANAQAPMQTEPVVDTGLQDAWESFIGSNAAPASPAKAGSLLSKFRGTAFVELAERLKMRRAILIAFRDRVIEPSTIPESILRRVAEALESTVQAVRDYLSHPPLVIQTAQFKSDKKPASQGRISFRELVERTEMSDEERKALLQECDSDGLNRG